MYKQLLFVMACLCMLPLCAMQETKKQLIVGTNAEFYPFTFIENDTIQGFDIDVAKEVCKRLGKEMVLKDMPFDALIQTLTLGDVQFVAAGMSYTEERAKRVLFTKPYITEDPLVILTQKGKEMSLDTLKDKTIAVNDGYVADILMTQKQKQNANFELLRLPAPQDAFLALKTKRADAFVTAKSTLEPFLAKQKEQNFSFYLIENSSQDCCLVISKKYSELQPEIQKALDEMISDGTMAALKAKWKMI